MVMFTANKPNRTLSIHRSDCSKVPNQGMKPCGCGEAGNLGNQIWWCELHFTIEAVNEFMNHRQWAVILCHICLDRH